jgi:predicted phage terminase large subunit-like protein
LEDIYAAALACDIDLCEGSFYRFVRESWPTVVPGAKFKDGWHIRAICAALQDVQEGRCKRLMIEVPPRHSKSTIASIMFPVWCMIKNPTMQFLTGSYSADLATRDCMGSRRLIRSEWFRARWGDEIVLSDDNDQKTSYSLTAGGGREIASTGANATGKNADILIGDDLIGSNDGYSDATKIAARHWYNHSFNTRLNDRDKGAIIILGQRISSDDIQGMLLERERCSWRVICFPGRFESNHPERCKEDVRTQEGELLWPEHFPDNLLRELEDGLGSYGTAGQIQQRPAPEGGGMFKAAWFKPFDIKDGYLCPKDGSASVSIANCSVFTAGDIAASEKNSADDTAIVKAARAPDGRIFILSILAQRMPVPRTRQILRDMWAAGGLDYMGLEPAQCGIGLIQDLRADGINVRELKPGGKDKVTRSIPFQNRAEAGQVYMNPDAKAMTQLCEFPAGAHDDIVDALAYVGLCCQIIPIYIGDAGEAWAKAQKKDEPEEPRVATYEERMSRAFE